MGSDDGRTPETLIDGLPDPQQREDARRLVDLMRDVTGEEPKLSGSIIGFGQYHYRYASGREGDTAKVAFAPRSRQMTIYLMPGLAEHEDLLTKLGRHTTGKGCLYVRRLDDVDVEALRELVARAVRYAEQADSR